MATQPIAADILWKAALEDFFDAFLAYFFPGFINQVDFDRPFEFLDQELAQLVPEHDEKSRRVDKLVKVWLKNGENQWFLVHVEAQGYDDDDFARRMFTSFYRMLDCYNRPITTVVIYTNSSRPKQPTAFHLDWMGTTLTYTFNTLSLKQKKYAELARGDNPFGVILQAAWGMTRKKSLSQLTLNELRIGIFRTLLTQGMSRQRIQRLVYFLSNFVHLTEPTLNRIFEAEVETIFPKQQPTMGIIEVVHEHYTQIGLQKGLQKGREEGRQEAEAMRRELVTRLIEGGFPDTEIIKLTGATLEVVQTVREELTQQPKA